MHPRRSLSARSRTVRIHRIVCLGALLAAVVPAFGATTAQAAPTTSADYGAAVAANPKCQRRFGGSDAAGVLYTVNCDATKILRFDKNGTALAPIAMPTKQSCILFFCSTVGALGTPADVAPSPDGQYLYLTQDVKTPARLVRAANGTYALDAAWKLAQFPAGGKMWTPIGNHITVDGRGDIYLSNGSFWASDSVPTPGQIVKYSPNGTFLTSFGEVGPRPGEWISNQDVAVSHDGRRVYVGENSSPSAKNDANYQPSRITRYDYTPNGQYRYTSVISAQGKYNGTRMGYCTAPGEVNSAYALAMDGFENLYAVSVTCGYVQQFTTDADPAKEKFVKTVVKDAAAGRPHSIAVDVAGRVYLGEWGKMFAPKAPKLPALPLAAPAALPAPDNTAPVVKNVVLPATTTTQNVAVTITATDNVAVSEMRIANEDGAYGPWQPFTSPATWKLSNGYAVKGVFVQVRDMAGNESNAVYKTTGFIAAGGGGAGDGVVVPPVGAPDNVAPVIGSATAPAVTATRNITINIAATDDKAVTGVRFANEDGTWSAWRAFAAASQWTITDGFVNKAIFVQVRDAAGNESANALVRTRYAADAPPPGNPNAPADTVAPTLTKIELPAETTTQNTNVKITAADNTAVAQVRFANEDGTWTNWQAYAATKTWTLSAGFGGKLVFAQVRDAAGNESLSVTARTNFVKTQAGPVDAANPVLTAVTLPETVPNANVTVKVTATDDVGVTEVRFANEDGTWGDWKAIGNGNVAHTLTAGATYKVVFAMVRDASGRESDTLYIRTLVKP